jgi:saccharopine dehydrogenase-like NADP-dependent oxidoreductase
MRIPAVFAAACGCVAVCSGLSSISFDLLKGKRILVVGGSGRVGGSVTTQLIQHGSKVTVGGTVLDNFLSAQKRWLDLFPSNVQALKDVEFVELNREQSDSVSRVLKNTPNGEPYDLVIHTAGPFQGKVGTPNGVLEASIDAAIPYIDVCDDYCTATSAKKRFGAAAGNKNVPCIVSTGCWPGVSSLMAKQLVAATLQSYPKLKPMDLSVDFSFFTAGSGGAGVTLLVATFLILAEKALTVVNGRRQAVNAMANYSTVNFGERVGDRDVAHLNLLETASIHDILGVGSTKCLFGTAPSFWNALLGFMAKLPPTILANEDIMRKLSVFSIPIVRVVDYFAGATNAMRCDVTCAAEPAIQATAIYAHENLEPCVGECVAAFCCAILSGRVPGGIWFPEEAVEAGDDAAAVLNLASVGAHTTEVQTRGLVRLSRDKVWGENTIRVLQ